MRWLYLGDESTDKTDQFVAYWVALESLSSTIAQTDSIRQALLGGLLAACPKIGEDGPTLRDVLYTVRNKVVHRGYRDLEKIDSLVAVARHIAVAEARYLLRQGQTSDPPKGGLLKSVIA